MQFLRSIVNCDTEMYSDNTNRIFKHLFGKLQSHECYFLSQKLVNEKIFKLSLKSTVQGQRKKEKPTQTWNIDLFNEELMSDFFGSKEYRRIRNSAIELF